MVEGNNQLLIEIKLIFTKDWQYIFADLNPFEYTKLHILFICFLCKSSIQISSVREQLRGNSQFNNDLYDIQGTLWVFFLPFLHKFVFIQTKRAVETKCRMLFKQFIYLSVLNMITLDTKKDIIWILTAIYMYNSLMLKHMMRYDLNLGCIINSNES